MINVALVGIGNNASAIVQGVEYYKKNPEKIIGVLPEIKEYGLKDINFVVGFDVNDNKIGKDLSEAIFEKPNCSYEIYRPEKLNAQVLKGPQLDGIDSDIAKHIKSSDKEDVNVKEELTKLNVDVLVIMLPTGAQKAAEFYAREAISAGCAVVNGMPSSIANNEEIVKLAEEKKVPIIGDDIKSQVGATIIHRSLANLFPMRGAILDRTIQLDWGGGMDFCNLLSNNKYEEGKRQSKTESVIADLPNKDDVEVQISAVDYIPFLDNQKEAYTRLEGRVFGGAPVRIDLFMQVKDNFNAAGVLVDCIRVAMIAKKRNVGGILQSACSFFNKKPPEQLADTVAKERLGEFLGNERER